MHSSDSLAITELCIKPIKQGTKAIVLSIKSCSLCCFAAKTSYKQHYVAEEQSVLNIITYLMLEITSKVLLGTALCIIVIIMGKCVFNYNTASHGLLPFSISIEVLNRL